MCLFIHNMFWLFCLILKQSIIKKQRKKRDQEDKKEEKDKEREKNFSFSQESKIILTSTEVTSCCLKTSKNIPPPVTAFENILDVLCLVVWYFKWYIEVYKIYLAVCFGLTLTTFLISLGFGQKGKGQVGKRVGGKGKYRQNKVFSQRDIGLASATGSYVGSPSRSMCIC